MIWAAAFSSAVVVGLVAKSLNGRSSHRRAKTRRRPQGWMVGLDVTPRQFWVASVGAGLATYLLVFAVTSLPLVSLMPSIVVASLPRAYFARQRALRLHAVQAAWPDGIRDVIAAIRSGASLPAAVESLATFGPPPLRDALQGFPVYARSLGFVAALEMVKSDLADPTSDRVIEVLILGYERGGNVIPVILADLAEAATRDIWTMEEIRSEALEQKINSRVVFVLPWLVLVAITARPGPFREFYSSPAGLVVVLIGAVLSLVGMVIAARMGKQPPEPRVFVEGRPG
jgi:tight adherence protein B